MPNKSKNILEKTIKNIKKLIKLKEEEKQLYEIIGENKLAKPLTFKIKNYKKWIKLLESLIEDNICVLDKLSVDSLDISQKLKDRIVEIIDNDKFADISETKKNIKKLQKKANKIIKVSDKVDKDTTNEIHRMTKSKDRGDSRPSGGIELVIYDLSRIYGIGKANAKKLAEKDITLEKLLNEWTDYVKNDNDNGLTMLEKFIEEDPNIDYSNHLVYNRLQRDRHRIFDEKMSNTKYLKELNHSQILGVKYFEDIEIQIPRDEMNRMNELLQTISKKLYSNPEMILTICGSYRRGKSSSGDIDVLITHPTFKTKKDIEYSSDNILGNFVKILTKIGFLVDHLTTDGDTKYMGLCKLKGSKYKRARRIDIKFVPFYSYSASLLYFTGSWHLNVKMREIARKNKYILNEYGLYKSKYNKDKRKYEAFEEIKTECEKDIFDKLKIKYLEPTERDISESDTLVML